MAPMTDYEEQTELQNRIGNTVINVARRIICYSQPIYNDERLEVSEYAGLQLSVIKVDIIVAVQEKYDNAAILILDDDSKLLLCIITSSMLSIMNNLIMQQVGNYIFCLYTQFCVYTCISHNYHNSTAPQPVDLLLSLLSTLLSMHDESCGELSQRAIPLQVLLSFLGRDYACSLLM